jgi:membrane protein YqaA with SNARE-associated domain
MNALVILFLIVLLLNIIPAFAPPTWMVFSYLGFRYPDHAGWVLAFVGAVAATLGRTVLAKTSRVIVRNHWLSESARANVDTIRGELEKRPKLTFGVLLFYAFTPLPSNYLFIAYGMTTMNLLRIAIPFLLGRFVSYAVWAQGAAVISDRLDVDGSEALGYFSIYFVITQCLLLGIVYAFTLVDWGTLLHQRKWRWMTKAKGRRQPTE